MIKFLTKVTAGISSQNNLIVNIKNGEKLPSSTSCSRCRFRLQTAVISDTHALLLAQPFHYLPLSCKTLILAGVRGFICHPLLWPSEIDWVLEAGARVLESGWHSHFWCYSVSPGRLSTLPQEVSAHFHKCCRRSLCALVHFLVNLILFKCFCGTYGISPYLPESLGYFIIYFLLTVPDLILDSWLAYIFWHVLKIISRQWCTLPGGCWLEMATYKWCLGWVSGKSDAWDRDNLYFDFIVFLK